MSVVKLPPQVKLRCDTCEEDLGDGDGCFHVFDADTNLDEIALDYDWQIRDGKHICASCLEEEAPMLESV